MHEGSRRFLLRFAGILLLVWGLVDGDPALAQNSQSVDLERSTLESARFAIKDPDGTVIGVQFESTIRLDDTCITNRGRMMAFSIDGHDRVSQFIDVSSKRDCETGALKSIDVGYDTSGNTGTYSVKFNRNIATIVHERDNRKREYDQTIDPDLPLHDPELISVAAPGRFYAFDLGTGRLVERRSRTVSLPDGNPPFRDAILTYDGDDPINIWLVQRALDGELIAMVRPQVGSRFWFIPQKRDAGPVKRSRSGKINHPMLDSPNAIPSRAKKGQIRYRIALLEALAQAVPSTPEQRVRTLEGGVQLDVCASCGSQWPSDTESLANWTKPSAWLQSDYPAIAAAAAKVAESDTSDADKLRRLSRIARSRLKDIDLNGHYSARAAWERRAGDCTEDAVVLAALARASGIPTRVASGIAYTRERYHGARNAFIPHTWVIAYLDGEWRSFDMTTREGFGAGHLALTIGDGEAHKIAAANLIAGMIEWESLSEIRKRPTN